MSKITKKQLHNGWHCHETEIINMKKELRELKQSVLRLEKLTDEKLLDEPQLKQLDQSVFDGLDEKWRFAAVDSNGDAVKYTLRVEPYTEVGGFVLGDDSVRNNLVKNFSHQLIGTGYDASNWQDSLIERKPELTGSDLCRKMLDDGATEIDCYVSDTSDCEASKGWFTRTVTGYSDDGFHTDRIFDWCYAVPVPKEKELTGSDLCRAMLDKGFEYVMCLVGDECEESASNSEVVRVVCSHGADYFDDTTEDMWYFAIPINNQGEPLTASEVGL